MRGDEERRATGCTGCDDPELMKLRGTLGRDEEEAECRTEVMEKV